ncbi:MAG: hypothetical protein ACYDBY_14210 [Thermoanaerobaculia bacterium]
MDPNAAALTRRPAAREAELDRMRERASGLRGLIETDVLELRRRVRSTFDLGRQIARHPIAATAVVVVGVLAVAWIARSLFRHAPRLDGMRDEGAIRARRRVSPRAGKPGR